MRKKFLDAAIKFEPFSALYDAGATPDQVKEAIVALLQPHVADEAVLRDFATSVLATDAICVGVLSSRADWKALLDRCFDIRNRAIEKNKKLAFSALNFFQHAIVSAQGSYTNLVLFEVSKSDLTLDEFAFELIRTIGFLIESNLKPYIKELYCLSMIASGKSPDLNEIAIEDFGRTCERFKQEVIEDSFLVLAPWGVRINQWRNVAQHNSYEVAGESIVASYGRDQPPKQVILSRDELLAVAKELVQRLGALKSSREITIINHIDELESLLPIQEPTSYSHATALFASLATQGFRLRDLQVGVDHVIAFVEDIAPSEGYVRPIHCSQFVGTIASRFPGCAVEVQYIVNDVHVWRFNAAAVDLDRVMNLPDPLSELAHIVAFVRMNSPQGNSL